MAAKDEGNYDESKAGYQGDHVDDEVNVEIYDL